MPKAPRPKKTLPLLQDRALERIQSELWQLGQTNRDFKGSNEALQESVDELVTVVEELSENIEDLNKTIKSAMRMVEDWAEAKEVALKEDENA